MAFDERDRASVVGDLSSPDDEVRRLAVERVEALPIETALTLLVERLGDASWRVRKSAVERLVARPETGLVAEALVRALADGENPGRRNGAVEALVRCGARVVPALVEASRSPDADVRKLVVDALAGIGDPGPSDAILAGLEDEDPNVRAAAADALGAIGARDAAPALLALVGRSDEDSLVRLSALRALAALEVPLLPRDIAPAFEDPILRSAGLDLLGREDEPDTRAVVAKALASSSRSMREAAMRAVLRLLARCDDGRAGDLVEEVRRAVGGAPLLLEDALERLAEADLSTRLMLVQFLGLLGSDSVVLPILAAARDEALSEVVLATLEAFGPGAENVVCDAWESLELEERRSACSLFARLRGERGAERLVGSLDSPDPELRIASARAIATRGYLDALPELVRGLLRAAASDESDGQDELSLLVDAVVDLARTGPAACSHATALLEAELADGGGRGRAPLARALASIARREDAPLIALLLKDPNAEVRALAVEAHARLEPYEALEDLRLALADEDAGVRVAAAAALAAAEGGAALEDLLRLADDADPRVRAAGARGFALRGARPGHDLDVARSGVDRALADDAFVALAALEALTELGGALAERASAVLERPEPEIVREAVRCLGRHAEAEGLEVLVSLASHPDWSVRAEAIDVLARRGVRRAIPAILRGLERERDEFVRQAILAALERLEG
jgi:HEAT repeat protein